MRDILFKAKRIDNGEWVEGYIVSVADRSRATIFVPQDPKECDWATLPFAVGPDTVCEYTGLTDKMGKKIWTGDIVKYTFDSPDDPTATENGLKVRIGRIFWSEWRASFAVTAGENLSTALNNDVARYVRGRSIYEYVRGANTVEVIGNRFDNPELLNP